MPGRDGTGPMGSRPMTGLGMGFCTGVNAPWLGSCLCYGFGARRALRQGFGSRKDFLQKQKEQIQRRIEAIDKELEDLE